jgi:hypothetical protein
MKRQIKCLECGKPRGVRLDEAPSGLFKTEVALLALECKTIFTRSLRGKARNDFYCDLCGRLINKQEECYAESICRDKSEYVEWEQAYIE